MSALPPVEPRPRGPPEIERGKRHRVCEASRAIPRHRRFVTGSLIRAGRLVPAQLTGGTSEERAQRKRCDRANRPPSPRALFLRLRVGRGKWNTSRPHRRRLISTAIVVTIVVVSENCGERRSVGAW